MPDKFESTESDMGIHKIYTILNFCKNFLTTLHNISNTLTYMLYVYPLTLDYLLPLIPQKEKNTQSINKCTFFQLIGNKKRYHRMPKSQRDTRKGFYPYQKYFPSLFPL